ncbi:MAG: glycosyltransferase family 2 protein [Deltaproteobacteria bacterium]|nr:glycosyltransferase family 2 protein [Deltaproteobacteria bacterium]
MLIPPRDGLDLEDYKILKPDSCRNKFISIIIPAYNEAQRIGRTIQELNAFLHQRGLCYELIVVNDGSRDNTSAAAKAAIEDYQVRNFTLIELKNNQGKGSAVTSGVKQATGDIIGFIDADLPVDLTCIDSMIAAVEGGVDLAIGARDLKESVINPNQNKIRLFAGRVFSHLINLVLFKEVFDTQCGVKFFKANPAKAIFERLTIPGFGFDVEVIFLAVKFGLVIKRTPVKLVNTNGSRVRLWRDAVIMFTDLFKIRRNAGQGRYDLCGHRRGLIPNIVRNRGE